MVIVIDIILVLLLVGVVLYTVFRCAPKFDPVPKREMHPWLVDVMDRKRKKDSSQFEDLLWNGICPNCGGKLRSHYYGSVDQFSDHWCTKCSFITLMEVLA